MLKRPLVIQGQEQKQWIPSFTIPKMDNQRNQNYKIYLWRRKDSFIGFYLCFECVLQNQRLKDLKQKMADYNKNLGLGVYIMSIIEIHRLQSKNPKEPSKF